MSFQIGRITLAVCAAVAFGTQGFAGGDDYDASNDTASDVNVTGILQDGFDPPEIPPE